MAVWCIKGQAMCRKPVPTAVANSMALRQQPSFGHRRWSSGARTCPRTDGAGSSTAGRTDKGRPHEGVAHESSPRIRRRSRTTMGRSAGTGWRRSVVPATTCVVQVLPSACGRGLADRPLVPGKCRPRWLVRLAGTGIRGRARGTTPSAGSTLALRQARRGRCGRRIRRDPGRAPSGRRRVARGSVRSGPPMVRRGSNGSAVHPQIGRS